MCAVCPTNQKTLSCSSHNSFALFPGTRIWDGSPVQTRDKDPQPGQNSRSQQQFRSSQKREIKQEPQKKPGLAKTKPKQSSVKLIQINSFKLLKCLFQLFGYKKQIHASPTVLNQHTRVYMQY